MIIRLTETSSYLDNLQILFTDVFTKENVKEDIKNNKFTNYFTYVIDDNPVAFINYYIMYERAELININVLDSFQNQKIASKLLEYMINDCTKNNVTSITLEVKSTNVKAIHLYQKYGFKEIGTRKGYYQGIDGILMEKELM